MNNDLFRRYVWLIETVRHARKVQFEEIAERWKASVLNTDGTPFALRTFHNHRHAIESLFGIKIDCDRSDHHRYFINEGANPNTTRLKEWMLQRLGYSDIDDDAKGMSSRIILDSLPEDKYGLYPIIEAIQDNRVLSATLSMPTSDNKSTLCIAPYCIRYRNNCWYLVGKDIETGLMHTINLECLVSISLTDATFTYPKKFSSKEYFCHSLGATDTNMEPVKVKLKIGGPTREKVRNFPLHESQKEVKQDKDTSVFEYFLIPGEDFHRAILSQGPDTEVLNPAELRDVISGKAKAIAKRYS